MKRLLWIFVAAALLPRPAAAAYNVLYLNFTGGTFYSRDAQGAQCDDARINCSWLVASAQVPAFDAAAFPKGAAARIVQGVRAAFAGLNLRVVTVRPASGNYHMIVVGGKSLDVLGMWVGGRSLIGCGNANKNAMGFVTPFYDSRKAPKAPSLSIWSPVEPFFLLQPQGPSEWHESEAGIIHAIVHEAGHSYGLQHTGAAMIVNPADFMCEDESCRNAPAFTFQKVNMNLSKDAGTCDGSQVQDSYHTLLRNLSN